MYLHFVKNFAAPEVGRVLHRFMHMMYITLDFTLKLST